MIRLIRGELVVIDGSKLQVVARKRKVVGRKKLKRQIQRKRRSCHVLMPFL